MGLNLTSATYKQLYSKYLDNLLWLRRDNYNEVENLVLGNRGWINLGRGNSTYFSVLSLCLKKDTVYKRAFKTPVPNEPLSTLVYGYYIIGHDNLLYVEFSGGRSPCVN